MKSSRRELFRCDFAREKTGFEVMRTTRNDCQERWLSGMEREDYFTEMDMTGRGEELVRRDKLELEPIEA